MKTILTFNFFKRNKANLSARFKTYVLKSALLFFIVLSSVQSLNAQVFSTVGNGTNYNCSTCYPAPYGNYFYGARHQMYVSPAELTAAGLFPGSNIVSLGFNVFSLNTSTTPHVGWTVTVYTTTSSDPLASAYVNTGQVSSSAPANTLGSLGWNHTAITPFIWNGTDGIVVETCFNNTAWQANYSTYWTDNLSGPAIKSRYNYADNATNCTTSSVYSTATIRPNIRFEWYGSPCNTPPAANSSLPSSFTTCPGLPNPTLTLANTYTFAGITYQWYSSTLSPVGLFTPITGATLSSAPAPTVGVTTWFQAVVSCTNPGGGTTSVTASQIFVAGSTTSVVPYYEDFEGVMMTNRLPNCSWYAQNLGSSVTTYTSSSTNNRVANSGTKFAAFGLPSTNNYVYSNGIAMNAGITYSASIQYATEYLGASNWTSLQILVGPNQSTTGLVQVASVGPAVSGAYKELAGYFTVPSAGNYYVAIKATAASGSALYLSWDDLRVGIPCEGTAGAVNAPTVTVASPSQTICLGKFINLSASGADTFTWNTGATTSGITESPTSAGFAYYTVTGQNALTGCMHTVTQTITVDQSPIVLASAFPVTACIGSPVSLNAMGNGVSYSWSNGLNGAVVTVTASSPTSYTVIATGANGCTSEAGVVVNTHSAASVVATGGSPDACVGDQVTLNASGGVTYKWISSASANVLQGSAVNVVLNGPTQFTVTATNAQGCTAKTTVQQNANICVGVKEFANAISGLMVYPNPVSDAFTVELNSEISKTIEVMDLTGRVILSTTSADEKINVNVRELANGVYYVRVKTNDAVDVIKVVKQ